MNNMNELLQKTKEIIERNDKLINETGKGFNLISILGMDHKETKTHSNIIAELLDSNGSHTFGNRFFKLFLEEVGIKNFDTNNYQVLREEFVGEIECSDKSLLRTFLDIVVKDKTTGKVILIENKIWAEDQYDQLERYYDSYHDKIVKLFYLNVFNYDYSFNFEADKLEHAKKVYQSISYESNIKNWLANCIIASKEKPFVSRQIEAYYQTILKISNQDIYKKMNEEIKNEILLSKENFKTAEEISNIYFQIKNEIKSIFELKLSEKIPLNGLIPYKTYRLHYSITEDASDGFFLGFQLYDENAFVGNDESFNQKFLQLREHFAAKNKCSNPNTWWNGWFSASSASKLANFSFSNLPTDVCFDFYKNIDFEVEIIYKEFSDIINQLKILLKEEI